MFNVFVAYPLDSTLKPYKGRCGEVKFSCDFQIYTYDIKQNKICNDKIVAFKFDEEVFRSILLRQGQDLLVLSTYSCLTKNGKDYFIPKANTRYVKMVDILSIGAATRLVAAEYLLTYGKRKTNFSYNQLCDFASTIKSLDSKPLTFFSKNECNKYPMDEREGTYTVELYEETFFDDSDIYFNVDPITEMVYMCNDDYLESSFWFIEAERPSQKCSLKIRDCYLAK